jgi:galactoside O-acetyltransferase
MAYLSAEKLSLIGFKSIGKNVKISERASIYNATKISIGNNVRIDDFCILSAGDGGIYLGSHVHIAAYTSIIGAGKVSVGNYCNISSRVSIYASSDDYSGAYLTSPVIEAQFTNVDHSPVTIASHCIVGCGSVILPGSILNIGVAIGALSLVKGELETMGIYAGVPLRMINTRSDGMFKVAMLHKEKYETQTIF